MASIHSPRFIHTLLVGIFATFVFLLFVPTPTYATTTVEHAWAKRLGGTDWDSGRSLTTDTSGNVYVTGYVNGTADLNGDGDSGDGAESATGYGSDDIVITSFDASGTHRWAKRLGGTSGDSGHSITTDASGNVYVTGSALEAADLNGDGDSGDSGESATGYGIGDIIISSFDASGTHRWAKRLGGTGGDSGESIIIDTSGNVYVMGYATGTADLNGNGTSTDGGAESATGYGDRDTIITSFDSSGTHRWAKRLGGASWDYGRSLTTDTSGNVYVTGYVNGTADLNGDGDSGDSAESATGYGGSDIVITSFDSSGTHRWAKRLGGTSYDLGYSITLDTSGNVYVTGMTNGNADLNGDGDSGDSAESAAGYGSNNIFISSFDSSGTHRWAKRLGGMDHDSGESITIDTSGNVYVTGETEGTADLNGNGTSTDGGAESATGYGSIDIVITSFDSSGTHRWAKRLGGTGGDSGESIIIDTSGNVYVMGYVNGTADLNGDGDSGDSAESAAGYGDHDIVITSFDSSGTHRWAKRLGGTDWDEGESITTDTSGNVYVTGYVYGTADLNGDGDSGDSAESAAGYGEDDLVITVFSPGSAPTLTLNSITATTSPILTGTATDALSTMSTVEFQVSTTTGAWSACIADDSTFDEANEPFTCTLGTVTPAPYTVYVRATDSSANTTAEGDEESESFTLLPEEEEEPRHSSSGSRAKRPDSTPPTPTLIPAPTTAPVTPAVITLITQHRALFIAARDLGISIPQFVLDIIEKTPDSFRFTQDLSLGVRHPEVQKLQQFLNTRGFTVSLHGAGSAGNETTYFGLATQSAVAQFQEAYKEDILTPYGLTTPTGQFRKRSMEKANALLAEMS